MFDEHAMAQSQVTQMITALNTHFPSRPLKARSVRFGEEDNTLPPTHDGQTLTLPYLDPAAQTVAQDAFSTNVNPNGFTISDTEEGFVINDAELGNSVAKVEQNLAGGRTIRNVRGTVYILRPVIPTPVTTVHQNDILVIGNRAVQPLKTPPNNPQA